MITKDEFIKINTFHYILFFCSSLYVHWQKSVKYLGYFLFLVYLKDFCLTIRDKKHLTGNSSKELATFSIEYLPIMEKMNESYRRNFIFLFPEKYGVVPKKCFPESHSSEASRRMNDVLNHKVDCCILLHVYVDLYRMRIICPTIFS